MDNGEVCGQAVGGGNSYCLVLPIARLPYQEE